MNLKKNHYSRRALALLLLRPSRTATMTPPNTGCRHLVEPMSWTPTVL